MKILKLTEADYQTLVLTIGFANGASIKQDALIPEAQKELTDWILIQGSDDNYTYWHDKRLLREQKEKELKNESAEDA